MTFVSFLGFGLIVTILLIIIRRERPELAVLLAMASAGIILVNLLKYLTEIVAVFETLALNAEVKLEYLKLIIRIIGIAYLAGFGAQICKDAGEHSMASKIELAGKIFILSMGLPVMAGLLDLILKVF